MSAQPVVAPTLPPEPQAARLIAAYDEAMAIAVAAVEEAFVRGHGDWGERMRAALAELLELAAANPEQARLCTVEIFDAGQLGLDRRDRWISRFMRLCEAGYAQAGSRAPTRLLPQVVAGSLFELIRVHVIEDRLAELPDALPTATLIVIGPILGRDAALLRAAVRP